MTLKTRLLLTGLASAWAWLGVQAGENLLRNASFEEIAPAGAVQGWTVNPAWFADPKEGAGFALVTLDAEVFQGMGQRSLKIIGQNRRGLVLQPISAPVTPGERFRLSGWMRFEEIRPACARISVEFKGADGKWLGQRNITSDWRIKTLDWREYAIDVVVPADTQSLQVSLSTDKATAGTVWFDNLCLERVAESAPPVPAAPARTADTEGVVPLDDFEDESVWSRMWGADSWGEHDKPRLAASGAQPYQGQQALRLEFDGKNCQVARRWGFEGPWDAIVLRARRIQGDAPVSLYLSRGPVVFRAATLPTTGEWTKVLAWRDDITCAWGAKTDADKSFAPERVERLLVFADGPAVVEIDDIRLWVPDRVGMLYATGAALGNVIAPEMPSQVRIGLFNGYAQARTVTLELTQRDLDGQAMDHNVRPIELAPHSFLEVTHALPPLPPGYHSVDCVLRDGDRTVRQRSVGLCVLPPPAPDGKGFFGSSVFYGAGRWTTSLSARIGVRTNGVGFTWAWQERRHGKLDIDVAATLDRLEANRIAPIGFIAVDAGRVPAWAAQPRTDADGNLRWASNPADWENYVRAVAMACQGRIRHWSLMCEVDLSYRRWAGGLDGYVDACRRACRVLKEVDPQCVIAGVSVSGVDCTANPRFPIARELWAQLGDVLDVLGIDAYASPRTFGPGFEPLGDEANDLDGMLREALAIARARTPNARVAIDEKGWCIQAGLPVNSIYARDFGDTIARSLVIARAIEGIDHYLYFYLFGPPIEGGWNYGLWQFDDAALNPTPGVTAYATAARLLDNAAAGRRVPLHDDLWVYVFTRGAGAVAAAWTPTRQKLALTAELPEDIQAINVAGSSVPVPRTGARADLTLSSSPVYLLADTVPAAGLFEALRSATFNLPCAKIAVTVPRVDRLLVHLRSQSPRDVTGTLDVTVPPGWTASPASQRYTLAKGETATVTLDLDMPPALPPTPVPVEVTFHSDDQGRVAFRDEPTFFAVHRMRIPPVVDGDLDEFAARPATVLLDSAGMLGPSADPAANGLWTGRDDQSVEAWTAWDDQCFYLAVRVRDDKHVQTRADASIWCQDCFQFAVDALNDALPPGISGRAGFDPDDHEFGLALTPKGPYFHRWAGSHGSAADGQASIRFMVKRDDASGVTAYECAIPWAELAPAKPVAGAVLGLSFVVPDADDARSAAYWMQLSGGIANGKTPALYPNFVLME